LSISDRETTRTHPSVPAGALVRLAQNTDLRSYLISAALIVIATFISNMAFGLVPESSLTLIYLIAVVISAQYCGLWPSILAALLGLLAWDFFFTAPYFSLNIASDKDIFTLAFFLIVALIISGMTSLVRNQNRQLAKLANNNKTLYEIAKELATINSVEEIASFTIDRISLLLHRRITLILNDRAISETLTTFPRDTPADDHKIRTKLDLSAAIHLSETSQSLVRRNALFLPLNALRGRVGAVKIEGTEDRPLSPAEHEQLSALVSQAAVAIERLWLLEEHKQSLLAAEAERMRNALLISVSHDLRTPLTTIIGSLSTLELLPARTRSGSQPELISIALTEAQRLDRFIANLLDMTKLELGGLNISRLPVNIENVVASVVERAQSLLQNHRVLIDIQEDFPSISANFELLEQAIFNLVDNAGRYCPPLTDIEIRAFLDQEEAVVQIADQGRGIDSELSQVLFRKFARASLGDTKPPGTGLGLAIAKGFINAMGGTLTAANRSDRQGAIFTISLPLVAPLPAEAHSQ
jgi:two-component system sensor histidine kinase KdpD